MDYRLICLDLDGTLLNEKHEITKKTKEVFRRLKELGVISVLVSARHPGSMMQFQEGLGLGGPMIAYGGASVFIDGKAVLGKYMTPLTARKIVEKARELGVTINLYQDEEWYAPEMNDLVRQESDTVRVKPTVTDYDALLDRWDEMGKGASKILPLGTAEAMAGLVEYIREELDDKVNMFVNRPTYVEILPPGVDKGTGITMLAESLNIPLSQVIAAGDTPTDVAMIRAAGLGVAMKNAIEQVQKAADVVTERTNREDGVAHLMEQLFHL